MTDYWSVSFRVSSSQDKDDRYNEVLSGQPGLSEETLNDVIGAHDVVWDDFTTNGEPTKPYAIYLWGWRDADAGTSDVQTYVDLNP